MQGNKKETWSRDMRRALHLRDFAGIRIVLVEYSSLANTKGDFVCSNLCALAYTYVGRVNHRTDKIHMINQVYGALQSLCVVTRSVEV